MARNAAATYPARAAAPKPRNVSNPPCDRTEPTRRSRPAVGPAAAAVCAAAVGAAALAAAWVSDDGMITFRTVENLVAGEGFRWNVAERTQTATHPLWVLLLAACRWLTGELWYTAVAVGVACTSLAAWWIARRAVSVAAAVVAVPLAMLCSRTAIDYATGGLENPLVYLLVALFAGVWFAPAGEAPPTRRLRTLGVLAALLWLTRIDIALLVAPCLLAALRGIAPGRAAVALLPGAAVVAAWCAFAALYFGTIVPTPGHAKALALDVPASQLALQGGRYLLDLCWRDPATALLLVAAVAVAARDRGALLLAPAIGIVLQVLYTLRVGGDFMAGRFFSASLMLALAVLARSLRGRRAHVLAGLLAAAAALAPGWPPWLAVVPAPAAARVHHGIADERSHYAKAFAMWSPARRWPEPGGFVAPLRAAGRTRPIVHVEHTVGYRGLVAGPLVHLVEPYICDPLLVRLPVADPCQWRIGHFTRRIPEGYLETLAHGENRIHHPALARYYEALQTVLRAPVFDRGRLAVLWRSWCGEFDPLLESYVAEEYRHPPLVSVDAERLAPPVAPGTHWFDHGGSLVVREGGLRVRFPAPLAAGGLALWADGGGRGELRWCRGGAVLATAPFELPPLVLAGARPLRLAVPPAARPFEAVELHLARTGDPALTVMPVFAVLSLGPD